VAAFYKPECGVTVNVLAELLEDSNSMNRNPLVRERCCVMLAYFVTCLPDRYDHQQRLLPYLLSFYKDHDHNEHAKTPHLALQAIEQCGAQYEAEHPAEVMERRQYGVDGDGRCHTHTPNFHLTHQRALPPPFQDRPRLGARLFVRANTKRFLGALLEELCSWRSGTKEKALALLETLVVYCEEHLTMDFSVTLSKITKGLITSRKEEQEDAVEADCRGHRGRQQKCKSMSHQILRVLELMGRYVDPGVYLPLLAPRIRGDASDGTSFSDTGGHSESSRAAHTAALAALLEGSRLKQWLPLLIATAVVSQKGICVGTLLVPSPGASSSSSPGSSPCDLIVGSQLCTERLSAILSILSRIKEACDDSSVSHTSKDERGDIKVFCQIEERRKSLLHFIDTSKQYFDGLLSPAAVVYPKDVLKLAACGLAVAADAHSRIESLSFCVG
jgi:hypothetical protein